MNVISCPRCLRQYRVDSGTSGKLARCRGCSSTFCVIAAEASAGEPVITLTDPITPRYNFIKEGCSELAKNVGDLLRLAAQPVTADAVANVVQTVPRYPSEIGSDLWKAQRCSRTLEEAYNRTRGTHDGERCDELFEYFIEYLPRRDSEALDMTVGAFIGVLSLDFDTRVDPEPEASVKARKVTRYPWYDWRGW